LKFRIIAIWFICVLVKVQLAFAQSNMAITNNAKDSSVNRFSGLSQLHQLDFIDIGLAIINKSALRKEDSISHKSGIVFASPVPAIGYSLQTGFEVSLVGNLAFYTGNNTDANISSITSSVNYTQYHQFLFPIQANIWTNNNKLNIQTDWHYVKFPQATYGLGGYSKLSDEYTIDFSNIRLYTTVFKTIAKDMYFGAGYNFDYIWGAQEINPPKGKITDYEKYGVIPISYASGIILSYLYDSRRNSINAEEGSLLNLLLRPNFKALGSSDDWESIVLDMRKFIPLPFGRHNILALWSYDWFTFNNGKPPYILLPNTGGDPFANTGRGFNEGRFRGRNMLYCEGEYRLSLSRNDFLGAVIFANAQSFTEETSHQFEVIHPAIGAGLRFKFNKYSRTNVAIDYAFGNDGSKGMYLNLGEIF